MEGPRATDPGETKPRLHAHNARARAHIRIAHVAPAVGSLNAGTKSGGRLPKVLLRGRFPAVVHC